MHYVGRLAPSPTGLLHLGHAATFWTAQKRTRQHGGRLLLRNEDLDPQRSRSEYVSAMLQDLEWLGIQWEPPIICQSARNEAYRAAFERLLSTGLVYPCTCSRRELAQMTQAPHEGPDSRLEPDDEPVYTGRCRPPELSAFSFDAGANYRFRVTHGEVVHFQDLHLGQQAYSPGVDFGDFLVWRRALTHDAEDQGLPSYQLACVVDDAYMDVTEVVRGEDLLKSTARQILLQRALNLPTPTYFHTSLLRDANGIRLAKRHDALAIRRLREQGRSPAEVLEMIASTTPT